MSDSAIATNRSVDEVMESPEVINHDNNADMIYHADSSKMSPSDVVHRISKDKAADSDTDVDSPLLAPSESVIGWEQLAGETLLQQIRTVLAGIGLLAIIVQLARR